jgi:uncharacterized protein
MLRRTPCIGICSTTYGDLVCRGCKRFAHEIVGWNGYDPDQRGAVWLRLLDLRAGATRHVVEVVDPTRLEAAVIGVGAVSAVEAPDPHLLAYEALRQSAGSDQPAAPLLERLGLRVRGGAFAGAVEDVLRLIDQEFYERSLAQYERNFRTPAR